MLLSTKIARGLAGLAALTLASAANASLTGFQTYNGSYAVSTDGWGGLSNSGVISASVPAGSTVVAAYLYTATFSNAATAPTTVTLEGNAVTFTQTVVNPSNGLGANRSDVTSIVQSAIGGGGGIFDFDIAEGADGSRIDGSALVVVYSNASLPETSVAILDGFSAVGGDSTSVNFADPLDPAAVGFFAEMYLGISFSCCGQQSNIDVNGMLLTQGAGNNDDGVEVANGSLITVGGFDDPFSPVNPSYADDREKYDLTPFITLGDTVISIDTENPSGDDNIFLAVFNVFGRAGFNEPPPPPNEIPIPAAIWLFGAGILGMRAAYRKKA